MTDKMKGRRQKYNKQKEKRGSGVVGGATIQEQSPFGMYIIIPFFNTLFCVWKPSFDSIPIAT